MIILCTNGLKSVLLDVLPAYERDRAMSLIPLWGPTLALAEDIADGAVGDVAILTANAIDDLIARNRVLSNSRVDLARSSIGIAVRRGASKPDISSPDALRNALLAAKSIAVSRFGQSGICFPAILEQLGIAEQATSKLVVADTGAPIGEVVARGEAEMGVQQISELLPVAGIEILGPLPAPLQRITLFSAGVLATTEDPSAAKALIEFVAAQSRPLLKSKGLDPP